MRLLLLTITVLSGSLGAETASLATESAYLAETKPVLAKRCYACHGALKQESGLRLDTARAIRAGGDNGPVIDLDNPGESELLRRVLSRDDADRMPPEGEPLTSEQIAAFRNWVVAGAPIPDSEAGDDDPAAHWAFQPIRRPAVPESDNPQLTNPVDRFLEARRQFAGVTSVAEAPRDRLIRRVSLDLTGLPPLRQNPSQSYEEFVDELLDSPQHGERWARHWMDVWRYSDWYGLGSQLRNSQKHLWHWRDWIIESLNSDTGYDRMILEMLAADELEPNRPDVLRATGFLARNYFLFNRTTWLDDAIEHSAKAFVGLTINCAKCHDHKYDPISQQDYYRFRAIFEPHQVRLDPITGTIDFESNGLPRVYDDNPEAVTYLHRRGDPTNADTSAPVPPGVPVFLSAFAPEIKPVTLPRFAFAPATRDYVRHDQLAAIDEQLAAIDTQLATARKTHDSLRNLANHDPVATADASNAEQAIVENFDGFQSDLWELIGPGWEFQNGTVIQSRASTDRTAVRSKFHPPRDFDATFRFVTTGGAQWKSVGIRFDVDADNSNAHMVYASAYAGGPKVQIAIVRNGASSYPADGRNLQAVAIGKPHSLRIAVRDRLLNVWFDDGLILAYHLPVRPDTGLIELTAFDATAEFDDFSIAPLADTVVLKQAANTSSGQPTTVADARTAIDQFEAKRAALVARRAAMDAVFAADTLRVSGESSGQQTSEAANTAAQLQREAKRLDAWHAVLVARQSGEAARITAAKKIFDGLKTAGSTDSGNYTSFVATLKALESPVHKHEDDPAIYPAISTGRRLALARWITHRDNPLTARVAVNHVWLRHFGQPLVESMFDFGRRTPRPVHADLLDFLAVEFMDSGWSFRHLHRLLVTSNAYRLDSSAAGAKSTTLSVDPTNRYYWRMQTRRMESQVVRDSLLQLSGRLDLQMGGPSIAPNGSSNRRSVYFRHSRDQHDKFLTMFDDADILQCYRRSESVIPQQALALTNSRLVLETAEMITAQLNSQPGDSERELFDAFVTRAFQLILCREPVPEELAECRQFAIRFEQLSGTESDQTATRASLRRAAVETIPADAASVRFGTSSSAARPNEIPRSRVRLVQALLNHNDFVSIR